MTSTRSDLLPPPAQEVVCFPASFAQRSLWFIDQLSPGKATYNIPSALRVRGKLDVEVLERALQEVARKHETLRTRFVAIKGEPQQVIEDQVDIRLPLLDLTSISGEKEREAEAMRLAREEAELPFNLKQAPLIRGKLLRLGALDHVLLFTMHHIISDAWSIGVLIEEVSVLYGAFSAGQPSPLPELPIQYADYSEWQREWLEGGSLEEQLAYWRKQLAQVSMLQLPTDRTGTTSQSQSGATCEFVIAANVARQLKKLAEGQGATLFMVLLAAFQTLLYRYTGQDDITVGTPIAGRDSGETEKLIGFFINTLVLRGDLSGEPSFIELVQRTKEVTLQAYAHQDVPFEKLVEVLSPERNLGNTPLFQVMIVLQNAPQGDLRLGAATLQPLDAVDNGTAKFDLLLLHAEDASGTLMSSLQYNTDLFEPATINRIIGHYAVLLNSIVSAPHAPIHSLEILGAEERRMLLEDFNARGVSIPEATVVRMLEEQVAPWVKKNEAEDKATVRMGKPIPNTQVYVVDEKMQPVPVGVAGELCIGGPELTQGHLNRPELAAERFVPNPFAGKSTGEQLYRTGDLVRWLPDGNLEYRGRLDQQVKIRGFRMDLGKIEAALQEYWGVRQAVVILREDEPGDKRLVSYVVPGLEGESSNGSVLLRTNELRAYLLGRLPEYLVPSAYVQLEKLPLDPNGKIDLKSLPQPGKDAAEQEYVGPRNPTEETLCRLWQEVLRRDRVGIHDNFFKIGGHSLMALSLHARLVEHFSELTVIELFTYPTIAQLAHAIDQTAQTAQINGGQSLPAIKPLARKAAVLPIELD